MNTARLSSANRYITCLGIVLHKESSCLLPATVCVCIILSEWVRISEVRHYCFSKVSISFHHAGENGDASVWKNLLDDCCLCWVLSVDVGSDDQQVPVFSEQLLWNPY